MKVWSRWVAMLSEREPATVLALFRIACGICAILTVGSVVAADIVELVWLDQEWGGYRKLQSGPWIVELFGGVSPRMTWTLICVSLASAVLLTIGAGGRITALVALWSFMGATDLNGQAGGSYDELLTCGMWLLVLGPSTVTLSVDCRITRGVWHDPKASAYAWVRWLGVFQIVLAYWSTGMQKLSAHWTPVGGFSALYYILQQPSWHRWDMSWLAPLYPLTQALTAATWIWELTSPLLLLAFWYRRHPREGWRSKFVHYRSVFALFGVFTHLGIWVFMEVGPFTWVSLAFYICMFSPREFAAVWARVRR